MRKRLISFFRIVLFLSLLLIVMLLLQKLTIRKEEYSRYKEFYSEKDDFDVLFFGSSRVLDAIQPMELWEDYRIKSYNLAQHNEGIGRNYWSIRNALEQTDPKLIVLDISLFSGVYNLDEEASDSDKAYLHNMLDHMPLSFTKLEAIKELCIPSMYMEYIFPFTLYHGRWRELSLNDWTNSSEPRKGAEIRSNIYPMKQLPWATDECSEIFLPEGLRIPDIIQLCEDKNIELLFICMPIPKEGSYKTINSFEKYFDEKQIPFINLWKESGLLNYALDFADETHVNQAGSKKITSFLGEYINGHYDFEGAHHTDSKWDESLEEYHMLKDELIMNSKENLESVLLNLSGDDDYYTEVTVSSEMYLNSEEIEYIKTFLGKRVSIEVDDKVAEGINIDIYNSDNELLLSIKR